VGYSALVPSLHCSHTGSSSALFSKGTEYSSRAFVCACVGGDICSIPTYRNRTESKARLDFGQCVGGAGFLLLPPTYAAGVKIGGNPGLRSQFPSSAYTGTAST